MKLIAAATMLSLVVVPAAAEPRGKHARAPDPQVVVQFDPDNGALLYESGPAIQAHGDLAQSLGAYFAAGYTIVALAEVPHKADRTEASLVKSGKAGAFIEFDPDNGAITNTVGADDGNDLGAWLAKGWVVRALVDLGKDDRMGAALDK